jgi:hypothetical protein
MKTKQPKVYAVPAGKRFTEASRATPYMKTLPKPQMVYMSDFLKSHESTYIDTKAYTRVVGSKKGIENQYAAAYDYRCDLSNTVFKYDTLEEEFGEVLTLDETQFDTDLETQSLLPYGDDTQVYQVGDFIRICLPLHLLTNCVAKIESIRAVDGKLLVWCLHKKCRMYVSPNEIIPYRVQ